MKLRSIFGMCAFWLAMDRSPSTPTSWPNSFAASRNDLRFQVNRHVDADRLRPCAQRTGMYPSRRVSCARPKSIESSIVPLFRSENLRKNSCCNDAILLMLFSYIRTAKHLRQNTTVHPSAVCGVDSICGLCRLALPNRGWGW